MRPSPPLPPTLTGSPAAVPTAPGRGRVGAVPSRRSRRVGPLLLLSLLLHAALLTVMLLSVRRPPGPGAVSPQSFEMVMEPGTKEGNQTATKPTELPGAAIPPPAASRPPLPAPPTVTPPVPPPQVATPPAPPAPVQPTIEAAKLPPPAALQPVPMPPVPIPPVPMPPVPTPPVPMPQVPTPPPLPAPVAQSAPLVPPAKLPEPPHPASPPPAEPSVRLALAQPPMFAHPPEPFTPPEPPPPLPPPPRPEPAFPAPMDISLGNAVPNQQTRRSLRGTGAMDLTIGRAARESNGEPPRDTTAAEGTIRVRGAKIGKDWLEQLHEWWLQHSYYPDEAAMRGEDGTATIHVRVDRYGHVQQVELESTSGSMWLDAGAQAVFRNATVPPFPQATPDSSLDLDIDINFILIGKGAR